MNEFLDKYNLSRMRKKWKFWTAIFLLRQCLSKCGSPQWQEQVCLGIFWNVNPPAPLQAYGIRIWGLQFQQVVLTGKLVILISFENCLNTTVSKETKAQDFPGSPVVKTLCFHRRGCGFDSWSGKFHMLHSAAKKKKKNERKKKKCRPIRFS